MQTTTLSASIRKLVSLVGGDFVKLKRTLVARVQNGDPRAAGYLVELSVYEQQEETNIQEHVDAILRADRIKMEKAHAKYKALYPPMQID